MQKEKRKRPKHELNEEKLSFYFNFTQTLIKNVRFAHHDRSHSECPGLLSGFDVPAWMAFFLLHWDGCDGILPPVLRFSGSHGQQHVSPAYCPVGSLRPQSTDKDLDLLPGRTQLCTVCRRLTGPIISISIRADDLAGAFKKGAAI